MTARVARLGGKPPIEIAAISQELAALVLSGSMSDTSPAGSLQLQLTRYPTSTPGVVLRV